RVYHSAVVDSWRERDRELRRLGCDIRLVSSLRWNEGGRDVLLDAGADDFVVGARTVGRHPYTFLYDPRPIVRELRGSTFDVIDVHEEPASLAALEVRILARLFQRGRPIVFYGAQNIAKRFPPPFRWIERGSLRRASGAHCCNREAGEIFRAKGLRGRVHTIGLGVDVDQFAQSRATADNERFRVGYFGRLDAHKGVDVLIRAIASTDVELVVHGAGPMEAELRELAVCSGAGDRIRFVGYVDHGQLPQRYREVDVVAVPSLRTARWVEQFGRVAVEAMAAGVPVLASDDGALRDVVAGAGVLVRPGDVAAWRDAIVELADNSDARIQLRAAGFARAQRYRWCEIARQQLDLYREVTA
ncbi:MAG: glycosyltransferase family 4 protein, partial [Acidimicrobiales bacterium]